MSKPKTFQQKCIETCRILLDNAVAVNQSYMVLRQIKDAQYYHNEVINTSPAFYHTVVNDCTQTLFIETSKMYDSNKDALGVKSYIDRIKNNIHLLDNTISYDVNWFSFFTDDSPKLIHFNSLEEMIDWEKLLINSKENVYESLKIQRDKYYAHFDRRIANNLTEFFEKNKTTYENFQDLLLLNTNICNSFYKYFTNTTVLPLATNYDDYNHTVAYVEKGLKRKPRVIL